MAALALGVAACGGDDDEGTTAAPAEEATSAEETTGATSVPGRVDLVTPPGDELVFKPDKATAAAGLVTLAWHNESKTAHTLCLEDEQGKGVKSIGGTVCSVEATGPSPTTGALTETYKDLKPGKYTFYCGVDGHRAQGMEGTLTVK
jgi:plastocyanin